MSLSKCRILSIIFFFIICRIALRFAGVFSMMALVLWSDNLGINMALFCFLWCGCG